MYKIPNWSDFQQYRDRKPTWIKFHKSLLDNRSFQKLPVSARAMLPMLWLLASENEAVNSGNIELTNQDIAFRLRVSEQEVEKNIETLLSSCFIELVRFDTEKYEILPRGETETYRKETETDVPLKGDFVGLWNSWNPFEMVKGNRPTAEAAYKKALKFSSPEQILKSAISYCSQCAATKTKTKHVVTWLNQSGYLADSESPAKDPIYGGVLV